MLGATVACVLVPLAATTALAAPIPTRLLLSSHFGWEVNKTGANVCAVKEECRPGKENAGAGGFSFPFGVAVNSDPASPSFEDVYVADTFNHRVQELTPVGAFVSMFGWDVNRTKVEAAAPQAERNVCTAESKDVCQAGVEGAAPEQFATFSQAIAVDPATGDVYVADTAFGEAGEGERVQKFTSAGAFVLEIGKEVNETTKANLCTAGEACKGALMRPSSVAETDGEAGAFNFEIAYGDMIAVGGPKDRLYVGDHARVQQFEPSGASAGDLSLSEISASGRATGVAVDPAGNVLVADSAAAGVHEFDAAGVLQPTVIDGASSGVSALALDPYGRVGIIEVAEGPVHGVLYSASGVKISEFAPPPGEMPSGPRNLAFAPSGAAYVLEPGNEELEAYAAFVFPEAKTCAATEVAATSAKLCGEINPDGVPATGFFQYGTSPALGSQTPVAFEGAGEAFAPVSSQLTGLTPNQSYRARVAVEAEAGGEKLRGHGDDVTFHTPVIAAQVQGVPSASFITAQSAVVNATVNPEHTSTRYHFQYGACPSLAGCAGVQSTPDETSAVYGAIGATAELTGLAPATTYSYRLVADNEFEEEPGKTVGGKATGTEGTFTAAAAPTVTAATGPPSAVTSTSAVISGIVNPDGQPATYSFELGVYAGAATRFGVVVSGPTGGGAAPVTEAQQLTGLQPGGAYAYRIVIRGGYGEAVGAPATFTTAGLPSVLASPPALPLLATPGIAFPAETPPKPTAKCKRDKHGRCVKVKKKTKRHRSRAHKKSRK
ncbi:MAG TPA: NHL repeat-containing protein [Solirubrobacteraceae bacterium]|nr:NHL repeat-containing protein [Solirubrobacteraceae bacterium]